MSSHEAKFQAKQNSDNVLRLLRLFLDTHHLSLEELAGLLRITPQTLEEWFSEGTAPPASCLALAVLFDTRRQISGRMVYERSKQRAVQQPLTKHAFLKV